MTASIPTSLSTEHLIAALYGLLDETFDNVRGCFLDRGTSLFETLAAISAEKASIPVGGRCSASSRRDS
ncbi:MAG: hypothetical protein WHS90_05515 [Caldilinea sp.]|uniref:hypothetical protein n=1 Tax=Caldilinea sp. TaxID=2293560 RepID=UPI0030B6C8B1